MHVCRGADVIDRRAADVGGYELRVPDSQAQKGLGPRVAELGQYRTLFGRCPMRLSLSATEEIAEAAADHLPGVRRIATRGCTTLSRKPKHHDNIGPHSRSIPPGGRRIRGRPNDRALKRPRDLEALVGGELRLSHCTSRVADVVSTLKIAPSNWYAIAFGVRNGYPYQ